MTKYVIDAHAWIEYFVASERGKEVREILENEQNEIFTSSLTIAEVMSVTKREGRDFDATCENIIINSKIIDISLEFCKGAGLLHAEIRGKIRDFGLADAFVLLAARKLGAKILTGDPHFKGFKEAVLI